MGFDRSEHGRHPWADRVGYQLRDAQERQQGEPTNLPSTGSEPLTADTLASTCTASESTLSARTTITDGALRTDSGLDQNGDNDYTDSGDILPVDITP